MGILAIILAFAAILLILIIIIQNPKGGGINSTFGGSQAANQLIGAANSADLLEKITWGLATTVFVGCLAFSFLTKSSSVAPRATNNTDVPPMELPVNNGGK